MVVRLGPSPAPAVGDLKRFKLVRDLGPSGGQPGGLSPSTGLKLETASGEGTFMTTIRLYFAALTLAGGFLALTPGESLAQKRQRDRITREEILKSAHSELDLFQVIRSLRPHFLQPPPGVRTLGGANAPAPVAVYVDGRRETGIDALRTIMALQVEEVRHLDATRSENEFGPAASGGAVLVKLYNAPRMPAPARDTTPVPPR
jgi:hypothetical protein